MKNKQTVVLPDNEMGLIQRACAGDQNALGQVLLMQSGRLARYIRRRLPASISNVVGEDDILQKTLIHAVQKIGDLEARSERAFSAWLNTIANRLIVDAVREHTALKRGGSSRIVRKVNPKSHSSVADLVELLSNHGVSPSSVAARNEAIQAIQVGIAQLPTDQRVAVQTHLLEERSLHATAIDMGRTPNAVRGLIHRAKGRLREMLGSASRWQKN